MADTEKATKLFYSESRFESYLRLLKAELIEDDLSNEHMLITEYSEEKLPSDPIRTFVSALTDQQLTTYNAAVAAAGLHVPTKLEVLRAPKAVTTAFIAFIEETDQTDEKLCSIIAEIISRNLQISFNFLTFSVEIAPKLVSEDT